MFCLNRNVYNRKKKKDDNARTIKIIKPKTLLCSKSNKEKIRILSLNLVHGR